MLPPKVLAREEVSGDDDDDGLDDGLDDDDDDDDDCRWVTRYERPSGIFFPL